MRRKINLGISLKEQLRDDPNFANLDSKKFKKEMRKIQDGYLGPLECVDNYLEYLGRDGLYDTVSKGRDGRGREGRWQAFIDYHNNVHKKLLDKNKLIGLGIKDDEVGKVEDAAFKIIRKREISQCGKVHDIMRKFPKYLRNTESKKELLKLSEIENELPQKERFDKEGREYDARTLDKLWGAINETEITEHVKKAIKIYEYSQQTETPLGLLEAALKKLKHDKMDLETIQAKDMPKARKLIIDIRKRIKKIETDHYYLQKKLKRKKK